MLDADLVQLEEGELLLVAQHLQRRLAQHGEEQGAPFGRRMGEHDLVRQRRLAAAGRAGDQGKREFGQAAAAKKNIEPGDASTEFPQSYFFAHCFCSS
jgi:predicted GIY-YIG superfamily endonuclease